MFDHPLDTVSNIKFKITGEPYRANEQSKVNNSLHAHIPTIVSIGTAGYFVLAPNVTAVSESPCIHYYRNNVLRLGFFLPLSICIHFYHLLVCVFAVANSVL